MHLKNVTLELSTKPFRNDSEELMRSVCTHLFTQWKDLTDAADVVTVMLWTADGSEILNYSGDLDQTFEWACWCGCANNVPADPNPSPRIRRDTHRYPVKYDESAQPRPYRWLKRLVEVIRETGTAITGKPIRVGETYDNGPEFAKSEFKYRLHREICQASSIFPNSFVTCTATLDADSRRYAAFPNGIPQGTSVGTFLGSQFRELAHDIGFDFLWLSNGMGFGTETWGITGMLFDKRQFHPERASEAASLMLSFWHDLLAACPGCVIETRGSNFSAGLEIATDACPLAELYRDLRIAPPVNSPWAALNYNTGLELAAWMSHVAELPDDRFPFRFYTHDPWFMNSPWLDRYGREPWDIFQPLAIGRINGNATTTMANSVNLLSADNTWGELPNQVPREVIPLLYDAFDNGPDAPAPLVWVYPFDEYNARVRQEQPRPDIVFSEDFYLGETLQCGLPLNTVISTASLRQLVRDGHRNLDQAILVIPASAATDENRDAIETLLRRGASAIFYGALSGAPAWLARLLHLRAADTPLTGRVSIVSDLPEDDLDDGLPDSAFVHPQHTCGGLVELLDEDDTHHALAFAEQDGQRRVIAAVADLPGGSRAAFLRCLLPAAENVGGGRNFDYASAGDAYPVPSLMRKALAQFGWKLHCHAYERQALLPRTSISRHDNALFWTVYAPDTTVEMHVSTPWGAPILTQMNTRIDEHGDAVWHPGRCWHKECRLFVRQSQPSCIVADIVLQGFAAYQQEHHRRYHGLKDAEVRCLVPVGLRDKAEFVVMPTYSTWEGVLLHHEPVTDVEWERDPATGGDIAVLRHVTGCLTVKYLK